MEHESTLILSERDFNLILAGLNVLYESYDNLIRYTDLPCRDDIAGHQIEVYLLLNRIDDYLDNYSDNSEK